jgi:CubicO group peptidase (beta-lactamase class C family)
MKKLWIATAVCLFCAAMACGAFTASATPEKAPAEARVGKMYGIGSVSKVFAAAAVMKLVDEGALNLDAPVATYIPDFAMADARCLQITPRMLLNHSSGLMGMTGKNMLLQGDSDTYHHDHFLEVLKTQSL